MVGSDDDDIWRQYEFPPRQHSFELFTNLSKPYRNKNTAVNRTKLSSRKQRWNV